LDGPEEINDFQKGEGYFKKTMRGYEVARRHGLNVSFITFTSYSINFKEEVFKFFLENGLNLNCTQLYHLLKVRILENGVEYKC